MRRLALGFLSCAATVVVLANCGARNAPTAPTASSALATSGFGMIATASTTPTGISLAGCLAGSTTSSCFNAVNSVLHARGASTAPTAPSAPLNLVASSSGGSVILTWSAPSTGDPVTTYVVEAGSGPGLANLANFTTNSTGTSFSAGGVGAGTYYVRMRAQNGGGTSAPSNESTLVVAGGSCTLPNAPTGLFATVDGATVTLAWAGPAGSCAATSYVLQAGSSAGLSNLANANVGNATSYVATGVGAGTYYVRVRAQNASGQSSASNEIALTVGSPSTAVPAGTWSYVISANVPLTNQPSASCLAPNSSGTTVVSSGGTFSIPFSGLACSSCSMSGMITGTIIPTGVSGSVTASISGSGCSVQQPTPSPAAMSGICASASCTVTLSATDSFALTYTLTPP